ncbi:bifunctional protein fold protein [Sulfurihydrogenibium azorense Az-Fu1]|jgi:methylenetetrahydrofolate dehydrogenase (NADP+)/methenyltetrahydrofolate cyclohydrolase|uniref:Bifunctional protein FolD n=2 Tax=Sulfurihydrogenibium azorense TaxID=309806 RepID=C1DTI2_SULAA|nr:bifunctional methylenetetrahydrofolate dehydrogenase/methenyltetrahydrofolate cyclohydrolase FolD [Sulfurihydrogenibium azorense]ACN98777.1 bifunctional protein fold protein [Sulfurihydrogenibium azorense Az-Fu1]MDM7273685.1 bifunctional methylenetetrahydrofolate dehydrogenase/methenyltetrahydrofolate cyclohydrolase FolD [Sulfurihydrogenibium azorense]
MILLNGKELAEKIKNQIKQELQEFLNKGYRRPTLAVILVGENPASQIYVNKKIKDCQSVGINSKPFFLPENITQIELLDLIGQLNGDEEVDGILVQLPLPSHINTLEIIEAINPKKDVDGFHPLNVGKLATGRNDGIIPCTPYGIMKLLEYYNIDTFGKDVVVVGASNIVGKPMSLLFLKDEKSTVTICHKNTKDLKSHTLKADILVVAVGKPKLITADMVKEGAVVIDVGINRVDGKIVGDVDFENVSKKVSAITPVPGGVGPMTVAMLLYNTFQAYKNNVIS